MYHSGSQYNTEHLPKPPVLDVAEMELHSLVSIEVWSKTYNLHKINIYSVFKCLGRWHIHKEIKVQEGMKGIFYILC